MKADFRGSDGMNWIGCLRAYGTDSVLSAYCSSQDENESETSAYPQQTSTTSVFGAVLPRGSQTRRIAYG